LNDDVVGSGYASWASRGRQIGERSLVSFHDEALTFTGLGIGWVRVQAGSIIGDRLLIATSGVLLCHLTGYSAASDKKGATDRRDDANQNHCQPPINSMFKPYSVWLQYAIARSWLRKCKGVLDGLKKGTEIQFAF
jgi:hypothetical protein